VWKKQLAGVLKEDGYWVVERMSLKGKVSCLAFSRLLFWFAKLGSTYLALCLTVILNGFTKSHL